MTRSVRPTWLPVVAGFLKKNGKVLLGQRPQGQNFAGLWEFPGGKIELGEQPAQALARELKEELGIEAEVGKLALVATHNLASTGIILLFFDVPFWKGEIQSAHHSHLTWVSPDELHNLEIPEANRINLDLIVSELKRP